MKKLSLVFLILSLISAMTLVSCNIVKDEFTENSCDHVDVDDDKKCDLCGEA